MIPGETISSGANRTCQDCGLVMKDEVLHSGGGYYIGTQCDCGPYSRESDYFRDYEEARLALQTGDYGRY